MTEANELLLLTAGQENRFQEDCLFKERERRVKRILGPLRNPCCGGDGEGIKVTYIVRADVIVRSRSF